MKITKNILAVIFGVTIWFSPLFAFAAGSLAIENVSYSPQTFSPDNDGIDDVVTVSAMVKTMGFEPSKSLNILCKAQIIDAAGEIVETIKTKIQTTGNVSVSVTFLWDGSMKRGNTAVNGAYGCQLSVKTAGSEASASISGIDLYVADKLSVFVSPEYWNIGEVKPGTVIGMSQQDKITVTNDGNISTTYSLHLINPDGWQHAQIQTGEDEYILNAAFSKKSRNIPWSEQNHALTDIPQLCTKAKFAAGQNGVSVNPGQVRSLWLQFKAPVSTKIKEQQQIKVVITANPD
ncbi:MAG: hypothetical protein HY810_10495 [Candidatus Omnitrophica bacterium]|nr:hypothetical protein [Candidatus Omnitrophota bacterium]